jgi:hypothetical protein
MVAPINLALNYSLFNSILTINETDQIILIYLLSFPLLSMKKIHFSRKESDTYLKGVNVTLIRKRSVKEGTVLYADLRLFFEYIFGL